MKETRESKERHEGRERERERDEKEREDSDEGGGEGRRRTPSRVFTNSCVLRCRGQGGRGRTETR